MADISLRDQLQPGLLDRLSDDERFVTYIRAQIPERELERLQVRGRDLLDILTARGLRQCPPQWGLNPDAGELDLWTSAVGRSIALQPLREMVIRPPGAPAGVALQSFCRFTARATLNAQTETLDRRLFTMRRLRESVLRDLGWLLNSASIDSSEDLARYPQVRSSVVNFGLPSTAGKSISSIDVGRFAQRIERAINSFEPRLSKVRVQHESIGESTTGFALAFRVEAELWGQPLPQQIVMRTSIDVETGSVVVSDAGAR